MAWNWDFKEEELKLKLFFRLIGILGVKIKELLGNESKVFLAKEHLCLCRECYDFAYTKGGFQHNERED
jgi:hypothetical protein